MASQVKHTFFRGIIVKIIFLKDTLSFEQNKQGKEQCVAFSLLY